MKNNVVYVAGKITGDPHYMKKFEAVGKRLREMGYTPLLPTILPPGMEHPQYMHICLPMIDVSAMVVFFADWPDSIGATIENDHCCSTGKPWIKMTGTWEKKVKKMMGVINSD